MVSKKADLDPGLDTHADPDLDPGLDTHADLDPSILEKQIRIQVFWKSGSGSRKKMRIHTDPGSGSTTLVIAYFNRKKSPGPEEIILIY